MANPLFISPSERTRILELVRELKHTLRGLEDAFAHVNDDVPFEDSLLEGIKYLMLGPELAKTLHDVLDRDVDIRKETLGLEEEIESYLRKQKRRKE